MSDDPNPYVSPKAVGAADNNTEPGRREADGPSGLPSPSVVCVWLVGAGMLGLALGLASRAVRPFIGGPMDWDVILTVALLLAICSGFATWLLDRVLRLDRPLKAAVLRYEMGTLALWAGHTVGWSLLHGTLWPDLVVLNAFSWLVTAVGGPLFMFIPYRRRVRKRQ